MGHGTRVTGHGIEIVRRRGPQREEERVQGRACPTDSFACSEAKPKARPNPDSAGPGGRFAAWEPPAKAELRPPPAIRTVTSKRLARDPGDYVGGSDPGFPDNWR